MNCDQLKITPCMPCTNLRQRNCWVDDYWRYYFNQRDNIRIFINDYNNLKSSDGWDRKMYFLKSLEYYNPKVYNQFCKLLILL